MFLRDSDDGPRQDYINGKRYRLKDLRKCNGVIYWTVEDLSRDSGSQALFVVCRDPSLGLEEFGFPPKKMPVKHYMSRRDCLPSSVTKLQTFLTACGMFWQVIQESHVQKPTEKSRIASRVAIVAYHHPYNQIRESIQFAVFKNELFQKPNGFMSRTYKDQTYKN